MSAVIFAASSGWMSGSPGLGVCWAWSHAAREVLGDHGSAVGAEHALQQRPPFFRGGLHLDHTAEHDGLLPAGMQRVQQGGRRRVAFAELREVFVQRRLAQLILGEARLHGAELLHRLVAQPDVGVGGVPRGGERLALILALHAGDGGGGVRAVLQGRAGPRAVSSPANGAGVCESAPAGWRRRLRGARCRA